MGNFGDYLNKYGVKWEEKYLSYTPWPNRNGQKLTGIVAHTEGVPQPIDRTEEQAVNSIYNYFNKQANAANSNCYITKSGRLILFVGVEHGNWSNGNDNDNVQTFTFELEDDGRWSNASTYTDAQYRAVAGLYCALYDLTRDSSFSAKSTPILFEHSKRGIRPHNEISPGRACPGAFNWQRLPADAQALWNSVNNPQPPVDPCANVKAQLAVTEARLLQAQQQLSELEVELENANNVVDKLQDDIEALEKQLKEAEAQYAELKAVNDKLQESNEKLKAENDALFEVNAKLVETNAVLERKLGVYKDLREYTIFGIKFYLVFAPKNEK